MKHLPAILLTLGVSSLTHADDRLSRATKEHMDRGLAEYQAHNYDAAVIEFQAAYAIEPRREILFAWGQAERLRGDCARALTLYRQFLGWSPPADEAQRATDRIAECERTLQERATGALSPKTTETGNGAQSLTEAIAVAPVAPPAPSDATTPWYRDGLGGTLVGLGTVSAAAGITLLALSQRELTGADYGAFDAAATRADRQYIAGVGATIAGGLLLGVGIVRIATSKPQRSPRVSLVIDPGSSSFGVAGRF